MVVFWNLPTNSPLQRIRLSDGSLKLYPFQCFLAHDQAVRTLQWCKANRYKTGELWGGRWSPGSLVLPDLLRFYLLSLLPSFHSHFLVSAGSDRKIKFWDLRRPYEPINSIKRFLSTELAWLLPYNGVTVAQDNCYASYGRMQIGGALGTGPKGWVQSVPDCCGERRVESCFTEVIWILEGIREGKWMQSWKKESFILSSSYSYGLCGIHYIDAGYLGFKAYFTAPRKGTVWVSPSLHFHRKTIPLLSYWRSGRGSSFG